MLLDRPVRRVQQSPSAPVDRSVWPATLPAVRQLLDEGLDLPAGVTFLVGENGSGKSTLVEAIAQAYGMGAEGGSRSTTLHRTRPSESPLHESLQLVRTPGAWSPPFFLRAETMHGVYTYLEGVGARGPALHEMSHGESFLELLRTRFGGPGFYVMDEPEAALSFRSCLGLIVALDDLRREGAQVLVATHSPLLTSLPGALLLEVGEHGIRQVAYDELDLVRDWRAYLQAPERYLRHLMAQD